MGKIKMEIVIEDNLEEVLDILEKNNFIVDEEIDKIFIRKKWNYIVWVGATPDYYVNYDDARRAYNEWVDEGYDDVQLLQGTVVLHRCNNQSSSGPS